MAFQTYWHERQAQITREEEERFRQQQEAKRQHQESIEKEDARIQAGREHWPDVRDDITSLFHDLKKDIFGEVAVISPWTTQTRRKSKPILQSGHTEDAAVDRIGTEDITEMLEETHLQVDEHLTITYEVIWQRDVRKIDMRGSTYANEIFLPQGLKRLTSGALVEKTEKAHPELWGYNRAQSSYWSQDLSDPPDEILSHNRETLLAQLTLLLPEE